MMATAEYFNLSGNSFTNVQEGTALYDMVHRMTNWGKREVIQWSASNGGGQFTTIPDEMFLFKNFFRLDLSYNRELTGEKNCSTLIIHPLRIACFAGLPKTIGELENLQNLDLRGCEKLEGSRDQLSFVLPILQA